MPPKRLVLALALTLPMVSIAVVIGRAEVRRAQAENWTFTARGYDPRDLLRGHYVTFRIDFREDTRRDACLDSDSDCCLCLTGAPGSGIPHTQRMSCADARRCNGMLQTRLIHRLNRYYVPEDRARELDQRVRRAGNEDRLRVVVAIDSTGHGEIRKLLIGGQRVE